jgi:hypothetical protein
MVFFPDQERAGVEVMTVIDSDEAVSGPGRRAMLFQYVVASFPPPALQILLAGLGDHVGKTADPAAIAFHRDLPDISLLDGRIPKLIRPLYTLPSSGARQKVKVMTPIHDTRDYHRHGRIDLMTEFTISESLRSVGSPYARALKISASYGAMVGRKLAEAGFLRPGCRLCEVGGGYGSLMQGLLESYAPLIGRVTMVDLSSRLLARQKACLKPWGSKVDFIHGDISDLIKSLRGIDLVILNEVIGDLDTWTDLAASALPVEVEGLVGKYGLEVPVKGRFHFNVGAIRLLEAICRGGFAAFISEHSSDPIIPPGMDYLARGMALDGFPREIRLRDHSEYTIRFSHLLSVAKALGRRARTGSLLELLGIGDAPGLRFIFTAQASAKDEQAVILEFLDHAREYRWLMLE